MARIGLPDITERTVRLEGFMPLMFDRYAGDNKTQLPVEEKMYFLPDGKTLCIPAANISSFLSAKNTTSVAKLVGGRGYKNLANALLGFVQIEPYSIPLLRNGEPICFNGFANDRDEVAGIYVDRRVARLDKGIPNPKVRPVVDLPWEIEFTLRLFKNDEVDETLLKSAFIKGGVAIGMGTFRGVFGKFIVKSWE
jgi:hypothetical protein